jgi:hypothetical protein
MKYILTLKEYTSQSVYEGAVQQDYGERQKQQRNP